MIPEYRCHDTENKCQLNLFLIDKEGKVWLKFVDGNWKKDESQETLVLQQWTGSKDKNGKKIFEGDKIRDSEFDCLWECFYDAEKASFAFKTFISSNILFMDDFVEEEIEVVGNVCEVIK